jgi:hypothetical protein
MTCPSVTPCKAGSANGCEHTRNAIWRSRQPWLHSSGARGASASKQSRITQGGHVGISSGGFWTAPVSGRRNWQNVLRFHAVYKRMRRTAQGHYAALIQDHYFDQSHFLKAFKQYTGVTPRVYSATSDYGFIYIPD